jgi:alpha-tubulin suppressor-like RCC1 family protein
MSKVPIRVATDQRFTLVTSSYLQSCAIDLQGFAWCWGSNVEGESGTGHQRIDSIPTLTTDKQKFTQVITGGPHTCGIGESGLTYCWGYNGYGQLGMFTNEKCGREPYQVPCSPRPQPLRTDLRFTTLAVGQSHTCGLTATGEAYCWGDNDQGQLGDGSNAGSYSPVPVNGGFRFISLSAGAHSTCGATSEGRVYCWGGNQRGQLGDGTTRSSVAPVEVTLGVSQW